MGGVWWWWWWVGWGGWGGIQAKQSSGVAGSGSLYVPLCATVCLVCTRDWPPCCKLGASATAAWPEAAGTPHLAAPSAPPPLLLRGLADPGGLHSRHGRHGSSQSKSTKALLIQADCTAGTAGSTTRTAGTAGTVGGGHSAALNLGTWVCPALHKLSRCLLRLAVDRRMPAVLQQPAVLVLLPVWLVLLPQPLLPTRHPRPHTD